MLAADYTGHTATEPTTPTDAPAHAWPGGPIHDHVLIAGVPAHGKSCAAAHLLRHLADALEDTSHELALARNELFDLQGGDQ